MSYRIEYQWACWRVEPTAELGGVPRFVVGIEGGDNNLIDGRTGKRVRSWEACMLGTSEQVLKRAVYFAGACEGGSLKPRGSDCMPEAYIRRIRRLLDGSSSAQHDGNWYPRVRVPDNHGLLAHANRLGLPTVREQRYGEWIVNIELAPAQRNLVFVFADMFPDLHAWSLVQVAGMPSS